MDRGAQNLGKSQAEHDDEINKKRGGSCLSVDTMPSQSTSYGALRSHTPAPLCCQDRAAVNFVINSVVHADFGRAAPHAGAGTADKPPPPAGKPGKGPPQARTLFAYEAQYEGDLHLAEGDVLSVLGRSDDGWWDGEAHGRRLRLQ